jgi:hypothetical protein
LVYIWKDGLIQNKEGVNLIINNIEL